MILPPDQVFSVPHYVMQFGVEDAILKYVVSNKIENLQMFIKQHNLSMDLMKNIECVEPNERNNAECDIIQIYNMQSNQDKKIYKVYTTERIAISCACLSQYLLTNDILFGYGILEHGYGFITKIIEDVEKLQWGCIPEFEILADDLMEDNFGYSYDSPYEGGYAVDEFTEMLRSSIDPSMSSIAISLEGYIKTFRYLMQNVKEQGDYSY